MFFDGADSETAGTTSAIIKRVNSALDKIQHRANII